MKGKNRRLFENKLISNIKKITAVEEIKRLQGRLITTYFDNHKNLKNVLGLVSYSPAIKTEKKIDEIKKVALKILQETCQGTFKVQTKRSDKSFSVKSPQVNILVGEFIEENSSLQFDFNGPQVILNIEINQKGVYLFTETVSCHGGLPTGVEGKVLLLVENNSSLLAGLLFMKRGCSVVPVAFSSIDISLLKQFSPEKIDLKIVKNFKELELFHKENKVASLVVGDNFERLKDYGVDLLVFRPLIAYSNEQIEEELKEFN